jgi:hypothetical protein
VHGSEERRRRVGEKKNSGFQISCYIEKENEYSSQERKRK